MSAHGSPTRTSASGAHGAAHSTCGRASPAPAKASVEEPPFVPHITSRCHDVASEGSGTARPLVVPRRKLSSPISSQSTPSPPESRLPDCRLASGSSLHQTATVNSAGSSTPSPSAKVWPPQSSQDWTPSSGTVSGATQRTPESIIFSPSASRASRAKRNASVRISVRPQALPRRTKENSEATSRGHFQRRTPGVTREKQQD